MNRPPKISVIGSLNVDHTVRVAHLPTPGETVRGLGSHRAFGGKGCNQAVAAARAGGEVTMVGCLGVDDASAGYLHHLEGEGIDASRVGIDDDLPTGSALITVDGSGENTIVVEPGANASVEPGLIRACRHLIEGADVLLMQLECPLESVRHAAEIARAEGVTVILNPSPWDPALAEDPVPCDVLILNQSEADALDDAYPADIRIVTRGAEATLILSGGEPPVEVAPPTVEPIDTVGAGDAFAGAFAVAHASGLPLAEAVAFANAAGALATLKAGAQDAIPTRDEIHALL